MLANWLQDGVNRLYARALRGAPAIHDDGSTPNHGYDQPPVAFVPYMMVIVIAEDHRWAGALVSGSGIR
jgi:hypothetical protein